MRLELDLGFQSLVVLVVCAVVPLIGLVLRSKWRRSAARKEEIRRLMILASEEAARAELETSAGYSYSYGYGYADGYGDGYKGVCADGYGDGYRAVSADGYGDGYRAVGYVDGHGAVPTAQSNLCAVCCSPTTTRCAQCKAVRYCSGKCQIIHWRQGHKDECHPPATKSNFEPKSAKHDMDVSYGIKFEDEKRKRSEPAVSSHCESKLETVVKPTNFKADFNAESSSESSAARFSGFSRSSRSNGSSGDVSICESISSNDSGNSDEHLSDNISHDISKTSSSAEDLDQTKTISPKFASLVDSIDNSSGSNESNLRKSTSSAGQSQCKVTSPLRSSDGGMQYGSVVQPSTSSATFWDGTIDPTDPTGHPRHSYVPASSESTISRRPSLHDPTPNKKDNSESTLDRVDMCNASSAPSSKTERTRHSKSDNAGGSDLLRSAGAGASISLLASVNSGSKRDAPGIESVRNSSAGACRSSDRHFDSIVRPRKGDEVNVNDVALKSDVAGLSPNASCDMKASGENGVGQLKVSISSRQYPLQGGIDIAGRYSDKGLFPYELFVKLYTWKEVELRPCGLINCGNSCYANAVLQCLAFTPPLTAYFLQGLHSKICARKEWCFMCQFENLILKAKAGESPVSPFGIVSRLENIGSQLSNGREEDAHEFLRYAIDAMESICLAETHISPGSSEEDTTLVGLTFGGYLRSKIRCTKCRGKSERQERMMDLTVEIEGDIGTLEEALRRFTVSETLDGENKYQCSRCGSYEKARKKLTIMEAPNVLTIALKRFQLGKFGKLNKSIRYPEILDLAPYMSGTSDKSPIYRLYGVIVHLDVMNASYSGHYVCYVKNPQNKWFKIDDSTVTPAELATVLKLGAYMLLYSRCSPRAPRSIRNQIISSDPKTSRIMLKMPSLNLKHPGNPLYDDLHPNSVSSDGLASIESFYSKFRRLRKMLEEDSPSDSSSLFSSNSDEGSSSSDGTRSTDDLSEYLFGGTGWSSPWRSSSDSDSSSTSLPSSSSSSPMASSDRRAPGFPETSGPHVDSEPNNSFLHSNMSKSRTNLLGGGGSSCSISSSLSSNCRESNAERLVDAANGFDGVKFRKGDQRLKRDEREGRK